MTLASTPEIDVRGTSNSHPMVEFSCKASRIRPFDQRYNRTKRTLDLTICTLLMPLALPLIGICALLIYLEDRGPIFLRQQRTGLGGTRFGMLKLRTMVPNASELREKLLHLNELTLPDFKISNDPRITRIGKILRKTSLDELPQLFNVLSGEMSLVGPRPTSFKADTYSLRHTERLEVLPGMTGLWQVSGRSDIDFDDRLKLDVEYIETRSIRRDIAILFQTFFVVFARRGAY